MRAMRGLSTVFRREVAERRLILLVGLAGLVPLVLPLFPGLAAGGGPELRPTVAAVIALLASVGLAVFLGATAIGSDLSQNRLGFYFARPLSGWAIWAGKLGAAYTLALAAALLVALPSLAIDGPRSWSLANPLFPTAWIYTVWAALVLFAVLAAHAASVVLRVRSAFLVLDLAAFAVTFLLAFSALGRLNLGMTPITLDIASAGFDALVLAALGAAGAAQVVAGRSDARRGHRALSLALWGPLLAGAMALHAYAQWVLSATPSDLASLWWVEPAPAGSWAELTGEAAHRPGYFPSFLVDLRSGRFLRLPAHQTMLRFSADGRRAAWLADGAEVVTADLTATRPEPIRGRLGLGGRLRDLALSPDGARVAAFSPGRLVAADVASGRLLAAVPLDAPGGLVHGLVWSHPSHVGVYRRAGFEPDGREIEILELDLATGKLQRTGSFRGPVDPRFTLAPDLRRLAARGEIAGRWADWVLDARTGAPRFGIVPQQSSFAFLVGDRCAELEREELQGSVGAFDVFGPDGRLSRRVAFDGASRGRLGGQPDADHLIYARTDDGHTWTSYLLDLSTGGVRLVGRDLLPLRRQGESLPPPDLFWRRGKLVRADLATGAARKLLGAPALNP